MVETMFKTMVLVTVLVTVLTWFLTRFLTRFWSQFLTWFWTRFWTRFLNMFEVAAVVRLNKTPASVSILPDFATLFLDFIIKSSFFRVNFSNFNKISENSSSEMVSSDNAFEMRLLIVLRIETVNIAIFSCFFYF